MTQVLRTSMPDVIKTDGLHRLQISDLFGGTRSDPRNVYRLVIRKGPDRKSWR